MDNNKSKKEKNNKALFHREKAIHLNLSDRDIEVFKALYRYRFLHTKHLLSLTRTQSVQSLNRRLRILYDAKFIDRPISQMAQ